MYFYKINIITNWNTNLKHSVELFIKCQKSNELLIHSCNNFWLFIYLVFTGHVCADFRFYPGQKLYLCCELPLSVFGVLQMDPQLLFLQRQLQRDNTSI